MIDRLLLATYSINAGKHCCNSPFFLMKNVLTHDHEKKKLGLCCFQTMAANAMFMEACNPTRGQSTDSANLHENVSSSEISCPARSFILSLNGSNTPCSWQLAFSPAKTTRHKFCQGSAHGIVHSSTPAYPFN